MMSRNSGLIRAAERKEAAQLILGTAVMVKGNAMHPLACTPVPFHFPHLLSLTWVLPMGQRFSDGHSEKTPGDPDERD
jgi:hypothetical protein